jgi:hypothetical protein
VIPAIAIQTGVISTDFFAFIFTNSPSPPSPAVTVTASFIPSQTVNYDVTHHTVSSSLTPSPLPQIIHIPFTLDLQVVSVEIVFNNNFSCVSSNVSSV